MKVSKGMKALYGLGFASHGIKDGLFQVFLFFYYSQVLGLDPILTGTSTVIALVFDAVSDPLVGAISDQWKSKNWGRRHPFMLLSAIPLGLFIALIFMPPESLSQMGLFWWLTVFAILVRLALTLFQVPAMSLGAEMSEDYEERTSISGYRIMFGAFMSMVSIIIGFTIFFLPTEEYARGLMNKEAYPAFATFCAVLIVISVFISTLGTKKLIPNLPQADPKDKAYTVLGVIKKFGEMFQMQSYRTLVLFNMVVYISIGIGTVFSTYFVEYYLELTETEMAALPLGSGLGGFLSLFLVAYLGRKLDKKYAAMLSIVLTGIFFSMPYNFRMLGIFPDNHTPELLPAFFVTILLGYTFVFVALGLVSSMMADVADENYLETNRREEGLFFASLSFTFKCTVGIGYFGAGLLLKWIEFPQQTALADISPDAVYGLGLVGGPVLLTFYVLGIGFLFFYPIDRARHSEIRAQLAAKEAQA